MKNFLRLRTIAVILICLAPALPAQVPQLVNYQGRVATGNPAVNFNGSGQFRFALVNAAGNTTYWSNDGSSVNGSQPTTAVSLRGGERPLLAPPRRHDRRGHDERHPSQRLDQS